MLARLWGLLSASLWTLLSLGVFGALGGGFQMIQVDEYAAAIAMWSVALVIVVTRTVTWSGIENKGQLTGATRQSVFL
jgi:hypothetical protein